MSQDELFDKATLTECEVLDPETVSKLSTLEAEKKYTAQRLKDKKPAVYNAVVQMLSVGLPTKDIAALCHVHFYTVVAVQERDKSVIESLKNRLAAKAATSALLLQEKILESIENLDTSEATPQKIQQLASASSTLIEKANLLTGNATSIVEVKADEIFEGDLSDYEKEAFVEGDVVDITEEDSE